MSWYVNLIGTPEGVCKKLDEIGEQMQDSQSKEEFLEAKPHLQGLLRLALRENVKLNASGHASFESGTKTYAHIQVSLDGLYGEFCQ
jgi:hypothetical protein